MLHRLLIGVSLVLAGTSATLAQEKQPITGKTCEELLVQYKQLPFTDVLPLEEGPISIGGEVKDITIGFSQTAFNHHGVCRCWSRSKLKLAGIPTCRW